MMAEAQTEAKNGSGQSAAPPSLAGALKRVEQLEAELAGRSRERDTAQQERDLARAENCQLARKLAATEREMDSERARLREQVQYAGQLEASRAELAQAYEALRTQLPGKMLLAGLVGAGARELLRRL